MSEPHTRDTPVNLGATKEIARRLVDQGRFESISEACREGLRRLDTEQRIVDRLVELGEQGLASGIAEGFDIDEFIDEMRADADSATSRSWSGRTSRRPSSLKSAVILSMHGAGPSRFAICVICAMRPEWSPSTQPAPDRTT